MQRPRLAAGQAVSRPLSSLLLVQDSTATDRRPAVVPRSPWATRIVGVSCLADALAALYETQFEAIVLASRLPDAECCDAVVALHTQAPSIPVVVILDDDDEQLALELIRAGAQKCLWRNECTATRVEHAVRHAIKRTRAEHDTARASACVDDDAS